MTVRVGVIGTSWWADTMYLPPLSAHPDAEVVAVCGRRPEPAAAFARTWDVTHHFTDPVAMYDEVELDAVVIATSNDSHHPLALQAIGRGLHVLCEKPLALDADQGAEMAAAADAANVATMVPFTYRYMPVNQWLKRLISTGYVGRPLHVNARYYTGFGFDTTYSWRFDREIAGSGIIGDLGSHWIDLARWLLDDTEVSISAMTTNFVDRDPRPDGSAYDQVEDSVAMTVRYASGAYALLHTSAVCWEETEPFGQTHHIEIHGDEGTLHATCDWDTVQRVSGVRRGEGGGVKDLPIPDDIWGAVRRDVVHDTYRDVFRTTDVMTRAWISAIEAGETVRPSFRDGQAVQRVLDAAVNSAENGGCAVSIDGEPADSDST